jgi:pimeloyl-ACP methyl ester carboxylesterase
VLLLHGYLSCKESFFYQINFLVNAGYRVTAPDILGFGASSAIDSAYCVGDYALWLKQFIKAANIHCPHIIAHSFGARVAIKLLSECDYAAGCLVLTGAAGLVKARNKSYRRKVFTYRAVKRLLPQFAERHFGSAEYRGLSPIMKASYKKIVNEDLRTAAKNIKNKTLLIYGIDDAVTPPEEEGVTFHRLICGSQLKIIGGDHFCFCNNAPAFNNIIADFLTEK